MFLFSLRYYLLEFLLIWIIYTEYINYDYFMQVKKLLYLKLIEINLFFLIKLNALFR